MKFLCRIITTFAEHTMITYGKLSNAEINAMLACHQAHHCYGLSIEVVE